MLSDNDAIATVGVKNLETAKKFYEGTLGLTKVMENEEVVAFKTGRSTLFVYRSEQARTNALARWLHLYNHHRAHTSLGGHPPMSRVNNVTGQHS